MNEKIKIETIVNGYVANGCVLEAEPEAIVRGYWIWWCKTHNQPLAWCQKDIAVRVARKYETLLEKIRVKIKSSFEHVRRDFE